ncbi:helix-turn-helix domain-containing protein [Leptospira noguchii]|uniref:helix-turn-helix domain-containing protein n=1 Tax=Leptospira noguchii TaxID=28182 RepID=UPI00032866F5|nr:helix-turn-helix domain-containing protein [Leptospira noguchii]EMS84064.1 DNA-binding helix-turn-helix protein [Leptospira noguchii str. Cascata]
MEDIIIDGDWIPRVVTDQKLPRSLRDLLAKITLLDIGARAERGGCYASNEYLGNLLGMATTTVAKYISRLRKLGYIEQISFDGRTRIIRSTLHDAVSMARTRYKISKAASGNYPSQSSTNGEGRGVQQSKSDKDKRSAPVRTKEVQNKTLNINASQSKISENQKPNWESVLNWAKDRITPYSYQTLAKAKITLESSKLIVHTPVSKSLSIIIYKYFTEVLKSPITVEFAGVGDKNVA